MPWEQAAGVILSAPAAIKIWAGAWDGSKDESRLIGRLGRLNGHEPASPIIGEL